MDQHRLCLAYPLREINLRVLISRRTAHISVYKDFLWSLNVWYNLKDYDTVNLV